MTPERLAELEALCNAATPGPWHTGYVEIRKYCGQNIRTFEVSAEGDGCWIAKVQEHRSCIRTPEGDVNGEFIAAARIALPEAIAEIRRLSTENEELRIGVQVSVKALFPDVKYTSVGMFDGFREFSSEEMEFLRCSASHGVQVPVDPDESGHVVKQEDKQDDPDDPQHRLW